MKKVFYPMLLLVSASSCSSVSDSKNTASTALTESILEKATGQEIDMADVNNLEKNKAFVKLQVGDENLESVFEGGLGHVTGSKETIVISTIKEVDNQQRTVMIGFTATDLTKMRPIKGSINTENPSEANLVMSLGTISENGIETLISKEGIAEIVSISEDKVVVHIKGKIFSPQDAEDFSKWKNIEGSVILEYPIFTTMGVNIGELSYK